MADVMKRIIVVFLIILCVTSSLAGCSASKNNDKAIKKLRDAGYKVEIIDKNRICVAKGKTKYYYKSVFGHYIFQKYRINLYKDKKDKIQKRLKKEKLLGAILEVKRKNINKFEVDLETDEKISLRNGKYETWHNDNWFECRSDFDSDYLKAFWRDPLSKQLDSYIYVTDKFYTQDELTEVYEEAQGICDRLNE